MSLKSIHFSKRILRICYATYQPSFNALGSTKVCYSTTVDTKEAWYENISKAMKEYLERARAHDSFIKDKKEEFELGRRHLANIMGVHVDDLNQESIDRAIEYLLPSGVFEPRARPIMKPPEIIYPKKKEAEFDASGRPFHPFFYTKRPNFYEILYEAAGKYKELNEHEDKMILKHQPPPKEKINMEASEWLTIHELSAKLLEQVTEEEYVRLTSTLAKLAEHPYSHLAAEFIMNYRKLKLEAMESLQVLPVAHDATGRPYVTAQGVRKRTQATVTVWGNGTGQVSINGDSIHFFEEFAEREQVMFPLQFTGLLGKVDIQATATSRYDHASPATKAGAIRHALSHALCSFVDKEMMEDMRLAGLLTRDRRHVERQKPGQRGARAKYKWLKR